MFVMKNVRADVGMIISNDNYFLNVKYFLVFKYFIILTFKINPNILRYTILQCEDSNNK